MKKFLRDFKWQGDNYMPIRIVLALIIISIIVGGPISLMYFALQYFNIS